jgi:hypothetical protein
MNWALLVQLIAQYGLPFAESVYKKWASGAMPTQADFDELRALGSQTASDRMKLALAKAGIPLDSPQAVAMLAMAQ